MAVIKVAVSFILMMISILFNTIDSALILKAPEPKTEQELVEMNGRFDEYALADEIAVVKSSSLSTAQLHSVIALQGIVSRDKPQIFIDFGRASNGYALAELEIENRLPQP